MRSKAWAFLHCDYDNRELHVIIGSRVTGDHCFILGGVNPPECQMFSFLLLAHALKKEGATRITGILPYLAYSREEARAKSCDSLDRGCLEGIWDR